MKEPIRVFLREIFDLDRGLWHTFILEKQPRIVNRLERSVFAASNSQQKKGRPIQERPVEILSDSASVFSVSGAYPDPIKVMTSPAYFAICTKSLFAGATIGMGCRVCGDRQLSKIPTCCTQLTVHRGAHPLCVRYSRWRISSVYCANGIPG